MYRRKRLTGMLAALSAAVVLAVSCAKISAPTGGPKDVDPPVIVRSQPANGTVLFTGRSFSVTFDEFVVLDKITEKFMISPPLETKPDVRLRGKSVEVTWDEDLRENTTYTFYFQDAIRDNNENNPIPNYQFVVSTGPVLDSLSLTGNVFNAEDLETPEDILVMMYSNMSDTAPCKVLPAYISRPDPSGGFVIRNIRPGSYRLFALKDLNGNRIYDMEEEAFAFCDSVISVSPDENYGAEPDTIKYRPSNATETTKPDIFTFGRYRLYSSVPEPKKQYLLFGERKSQGGLSFGLALPSDSGSFSVTLADAADSSWFMRTNEARDTFMLWVTDPSVYNRDLIEAFVNYPYTDSTGTLVPRRDTVTLRYARPAPPRGSQREKGMAMATDAAGKIRPGFRPSFFADAPLTAPDTSLITLSEMIDSVRTELVPLFEADSKDIRRVRLVTKFRPGAAVTLVCRKGAFRDIYGHTSDSVNYRFGVGRTDDYGIVTARLSGYDGDVIVQLLGDKEKVVGEVHTKGTGSARFDLLDKGKYRLRAICDLDGNGKWTPGDYSAGRNPEPVTYYKTELDVKINWELDQDWDLSHWYVKDVSIRNKPTAKR